MYLAICNKDLKDLYVWRDVFVFGNNEGVRKGEMKSDDVKRALSAAVAVPEEKIQFMIEIATTIKSDSKYKCSCKSVNIIIWSL